MKKIIPLMFCGILFCHGELVVAKGVTDTTSTSPPLFRYKNDQGTTVTTYVLPPEEAAKGYEIVTPQGDILQVVKPALTDEQKQAIMDNIQQEKYDKALMLKYASLAELMKSQKRKKDESDAKMAVMTGNLTNIKNQIESEQAKAANFEREGRPVPDTILKSLEGLYANLELTEDTIRQREKDTLDENSHYEYEVNRYKQLKGLR